MSTEARRAPSRGDGSAPRGTAGGDLSGSGTGGGGAERSGANGDTGPGAVANGDGGPARAGGMANGGTRPGTGTPPGRRFDPWVRRAPGGGTAQAAAGAGSTPEDDGRPQNGSRARHRAGTVSPAGNPAGPGTNTPVASGTNGHGGSGTGSGGARPEGVNEAAFSCSGGTTDSAAPASGPGRGAAGGGRHPVTPGSSSAPTPSRPPVVPPRFPGLRPFAPQAGGPASPPPPPASARFPDAPPAFAHVPDAPPSAGRDQRGDIPAPPGTTPPRPGHRPTAPAGRTDAPSELSPEITARLRQIRAVSGTPSGEQPGPDPGRAPAEDRPATAPSAPADGQGAAPGPVPSRPAVPPRPTGTPTAATPADSAAPPAPVRPRPGTGASGGTSAPAHAAGPASGVPAASRGPVPGQAPSTASGRRGDAGPATRPGNGPAGMPAVPPGPPGESGSGVVPPRAPGRTSSGAGPASGVPASSSAPAAPVPGRVPQSSPGRPPAPGRASAAPAAGSQVPPRTPGRPPSAPAPADRAPGPPPYPAPRFAPAAGAVAPDPALSWSAAHPPVVPPAVVRPFVSFGLPEGYDGQGRPKPIRERIRSRTVAAAACVVLGFGLIGGAVTGSWLTGGSGAARDRDTFTTAADLWHSVPVDRLFPPTLQGTGAGPGGADRAWTRIAVAPDSGCANAFDPLLRQALAPVGCRRLLRATYTDATRSFVTTVGLMFTKADATAMNALAGRFKNEGLGRRTDLMPRPYAVKGTAAEDFGDRQRASWTVSVLTDAPVVVYAVSGWADGRGVDTPEPAAEAAGSGGTTAPAQAGLGNEAQGVADRVERGLRRTVSSPTAQASPGSEDAS